MSTQTENKEEHPHAKSHPFNEHELTLIEMAPRHATFENHHHHHHHHHHHLEYRRPFKLTPEIGLFSLKKLNAMNPDILNEREKRLLNPVAPGVLTNIMHTGLLSGAVFYTGYVWKNLGLGGFARPMVVLPLGVLMWSWLSFNWIANQLRENSWSLSRKRMVSGKSDQLGSKFLLDVLQPSFRLHEDLESK